MRYHHTQFGAVIVVSLLLAAALAAGGGMPIDWAPRAVIGPALMAGFLALFYTLAVEIDATHPSFRFGVGLIRQRVPLAEIVETPPVRNSWRYGWGLHRTPRGGRYDGSGGEARELTLASGQCLRLGTDEPRRWARAIRVAKGGR